MSLPARSANSDELLAGLNEPQRAAVLHTDGPLLVIAGPGSGKTRAITHRAAYLARTVANPRNVLAITFTNKAASELRERIEALGAGPELTACTFHSLCARLLRIHHEQAAVAPNYSIFDRADRRAVIKRAVADCGFEASNWPSAKVDARISLAKNALQSPGQCAEQARHFTDRNFCRIYAQYEKLMTQQQALDFDDLLMRMALLLERDDELRLKLSERYRYVLIDEYQDTNLAQYRFARLLTRAHGNICATGDPDQSIYGWRGADIGNILRFEQDFPGAHVVRLEQNYRSTPNILAAADHLIGENVERKEKELWTQNAEGPAVRVMEFADEKDEARSIAELIETAIAEGRSPGDFAVCYRVSSLSLELELALQRNGLRYQVARGQEFFGRKEIKDLISYVRLLVNPADDTALVRIINTPARGIGKTSLSKMWDLAQARGCPLYDVVRDESAVGELGRASSKVRRFVELIESLLPLVDGPAGEALAQVCSRSGLLAQLHEQSTVDSDPLENVENLIAQAHDYDRHHPDGSLLEWLEQTSLISDADSIDEGSGLITLMTMHAAKGLEFPCVFIIGLEDCLLPFRRLDDEDASNIEEERRLCFVGMTRAKEELTLTRALFRTRHGQHGRTVGSEFLHQLPRDEIDWITSPAATSLQSGNSGFGGRYRAAPDLEFAEWGQNPLVRHPEFGLGRIIQQRKGSGGLHHVKVSFQGGECEDFIWEHSGLTRVDQYDID